MTSFDFTSISLDRLKNVCGVFVKQHIPQEASLFEMYWEVWQNNLPSDFLQNPEDVFDEARRTEAIHHLGAAPEIADSQEDTFPTIQIMATACLNLLGQAHQTSLTARDISASIRAACQQSKAPAHLKKLLCRHGVESLSALLLDPESFGAEGEGSHVQSALHADGYYYRQLIDGALEENFVEQVDKDFNSLLSRKNHPFDIIINEAEFAVWVLRNTKSKGKERYQEFQMNEERFGWGTRIFLWLLLTHHGSLFHYEDFIEIMKEKYGSEGKEPEWDKRIRYYRDVLKKDILGKELLERILSKGRSRSYPVHLSSWSYHWLRCCDDTHQSLLLDQYPSPVLK